MDDRCPKCGRLEMTRVETSTGHYDVCKMLNCDYSKFQWEEGKKGSVATVVGTQYERGNRDMWWGSKDKIVTPKQGELIQTTSDNGVHYQQVPKCRHWRQKVRVAGYTVTCSSHMSGNGLEPRPDFGVYLCPQWQDRLSLIWTNGVYVEGVPKEYSAMIVDWPDQGVIPMSILEFLVDTCCSKIRHGKKLDIGCFGGHGRTGTLLACVIARMERLSGDMAIAAVRERYCKQAVESQAQERAIREYAKKVNKGIDKVI